MRWKVQTHERKQVAAWINRSRDNGAVVTDCAPELRSWFADGVLRLNESTLQQILI